MDHFSAITTPAERSRKIQVPPTPLELRVGKLVALAASALAAAVRDYANGSPTMAPKWRVASLIVELFKLRRLMIDTWDFDRVAHQYGRLALVEACDLVSEAEKALIDELVNSTMEILRKVVLSELH